MKADKEQHPEEDELEEGFKRLDGKSWKVCNVRVNASPDMFLCISKGKDPMIFYAVAAAVEGAAYAAEGVKEREGSDKIVKVCAHVHCGLHFLKCDKKREQSAEQPAVKDHAASVHEYGINKRIHIEDGAASAVLYKLREADQQIHNVCAEEEPCGGNKAKGDKFKIKCPATDGKKDCDSQCQHEADGSTDIIGVCILKKILKHGGDYNTHGNNNKEGRERSLRTCRGIP